MAGEPLITVAGNLVADREPRVSQGGKPWVTFRIASTPRVRDRQSGDWSDGEALWLGCRAYGEYADNIAASLTKGARVIVQGRLTQHIYTDNHGQQRTSLDLEVEEIGPSLRYATTSITRAGSGGPAGGGFASQGYGQQPAYGQTDGGGYGAAQGQSAWGRPAAEQQAEAAATTDGFDDEQPF
ncbi:single-stranded DNA-binding protein [Leucobacter luti]|uniref:single-stranded DNA-binding protein n=1 Tax=Leucobacter luti TaxID=340320 RepID=UPI001C68CFC3|nr:single-stranded DNA-binding protein [Leucobacter luti]QYM76910.1 single-stranded DNA-binding protein [Leucobacter luti]